MGDASSTRQPLLWGALAFACGIVAGVSLWRPTLWWLVAALVFLLAAAWFRGGWMGWASVLAAVAALGAWSVQARGGADSAPDLSRFTGGEEVSVTAHVVRDGLLREKRQSVDVETESIERDGRATAIAAGVRLSVYAAERKPQATIASPAKKIGSQGRRLAAKHGTSASSVRSSPTSAKGRQMWGTSVYAGDGRTQGPSTPRAEGGRAAVGMTDLGFRQHSRQDDAGDEPPDDDAVQFTGFPQVLRSGQRLRFPVKLREPRNFRNPGAWDYRGYLRREGIVAIGSVPASKVEQLPGVAGSRLRLWCSRARRSVLNRIHRLWSADQAGLFDAMLIGERSFIGRETNAAWQRTGIYHILVVSGMNVGILAWVIFRLLRQFRAGDVLATVLTIVLSAGYACLADLGAPVLRSVLMLSVFLIMRLLYRGRALLNAIGAAALVLLLVDPRALFDASFQLTFLSVVAIAGLAVPILERTSEPYTRGLRWLLQPAYDLSLSPRIAQFRLDLRMFGDRVSRLLLPIREEWAKRAVGATICVAIRSVLGLYSVVVVSAVAQMAMTLPMAIYFHRATVMGLGANTLAVPFTGILMTTSAAALVLSFVWLPLAKVPALIAGWSLGVIEWAVRVFGSLPIANLRLPTPALAPCVALAVSFVLAMLLVRRRALLAMAGVLLLAASCVWLSTGPTQPRLRRGVLEITSIDVGQAESTLVVTPEGRTLLVDAAGSLGPWQSDFDFGENVIAPYLWSRGVSRLDAVMLTHAHSDHMGGMPSMISIFHPHELWLGPNAETSVLAGLRHTAIQYGVVVQQRRGGEHFQFGGARFEVLAPPPDWQPGLKPRNNDSLVLRVSYGATSALLTADAEKQIEHYLVGQQPRATLLKVGHNGSRTSTTPEFLSAVQPRFATISVGVHNSFGHPRREVLERLGAAHALTYRTDMFGAVTFVLNGTNATVENR